MSDQKLTILHCLRAPVGGAFRHVRDLARAQAVLGHNVGILCDAADYGPLNECPLQELDDALPLGVRRIKISRDIGFEDALAVRRAVKALRGTPLDVLHGHTAKGGLIARMTAQYLRLAGQQVTAIYTPHGGSLHYRKRSPKGIAIFAVERLLERASSGLVFVSNYEAETYCQKVGAPHVPWRVVHNGVLPAEFEPVDLNADASDFLFIGELRDLKGPDLFLQAIATLRSAGIDATGLMVGSGPDADQVMSLRQELGLQGVVSMEAAQPIRQALAKARTVVMPSRAESLPYVVIESVAAGHPLLATRVGGIGEIFGDDSAALITPNNVEALAEAMLESLDAPAQLTVRTERLRSVARRRFSVGLMTARITDFYSDCGRCKGYAPSQPLQATTVGFDQHSLNRSSEPAFTSPPQR